MPESQCPALDVQGLRCYLEADHDNLHRSNDGSVRWAWAIDHGPEPLALLDSGIPPEVVADIWAGHVPDIKSSGLESSNG